MLIKFCPWIYEVPSSMVYSFQETTFFKSGVYTIRSFFTWHHDSLFHVENNETAAILVCKENPVWIVLFLHVKT